MEKRHFGPYPSLAIIVLALFCWGIIGSHSSPTLAHARQFASDTIQVNATACNNDTSTNSTLNNKDCMRISGCSSNNGTGLWVNTNGNSTYCTDNKSADASCYTVYPPSPPCWNYPCDFLTIYFYRYDPITQKTDKDYTAKFLGNCVQTFPLENNATWKLVMEDSFLLSPFTCYIKTSDTGWTYADNCTHSLSKASNCTGCNYFSDPGGFGFHIGCLPSNPNVNTYGRLYLLDHRNGNLLFRGPKPVVQDENGNWIFDYNQFMTVLQKRFKTELPEGLDGAGFPPKFLFVDISLISNDGLEKMYLEAENALFGGLGTPIAHTLSPAKPAALPPVKVGKIDATVTGQILWWDIRPNANGINGAKQSDLGGLAKRISDWMNRKHDIPMVIFFHCDAGSDRTGEVAISYLYTNRQMDPKKAWVYGTTVFKSNGGPVLNKYRQIPKPEYKAGIAWYLKKMTKHSPDFTNVISVPGDPGYPCDYPWSDNANGTCGWNN